jgi:two-component system, probable response regulator PhcQ
MKKSRILLVDDEPALIDGLRRMLRREPFDVVQAGCGEEAVAILSSSEVDAVVSDQDMPGMRGTELLRWMREHRPDVLRVLLTGRATLDVALDCVNRGEVYRFLTKPCDPADLISTLHSGIAHRELLREARKLVEYSRRQRALLEDLEARCPGITTAKKTEDGFLVIEEGPEDLETLLAEISKLVAD